MKKRTPMLPIVWVLLLTLFLLGCTPAQPEAEPSAEPEEPGRASAAAEPGAQDAPQEPSRLDQTELSFLTYLLDMPTADYLERFSAALGERLGALGLPYTVKMVGVHYNDFAKYIGGDEPFDVGFAFEDRVVREAYEAGSIADLSAIPEEYLGLYAMHEPIVWHANKIDGKTFAIPLENGGWFKSGWETSFLIRQDILDALGEPAPESLEEMLALSENAKAAGLDHQIAYIPACPPYALHRTYDEWPFFVTQDSLFLIRGSGEVEIYCESDIFRRDMQALRQMKEAGVLRIVTWQLRDTFQENWNALASMYSLGVHYTEDYLNLSIAQFAPERENFIIEDKSVVSLVVSARADVDAALSVLQAIYADQDTYDIFALGVEGTDWTLHPDGTYTQIAEKNNGYYYRHEPMHREREGFVTGAIDLHAYGEMIEFPASRFVFQPGTEAESRLMNSQGYHGLAYGMIMIRAGSVSEDMLPTAIQRLYDDGLAEYYLEFKKQYEEYLKYFSTQ